MSTEHDGSDGLREIGDCGVWTLSSAKPGFGVHQLRDGNINTYWQSDGSQPHTVSIAFPKKMAVSRVDIYADLKLDESYTPAQVSVRCGTHAHDLLEVRSFAIEDAKGWIPLQLAEADDTPVYTNLVQLAVTQNHQNGRDTHLRQVAIYGPQGDAPSMMIFAPSTVDFSQWETIH